MLVVLSDYPVFPFSSLLCVAAHLLLISPSWHSHAPPNFSLFVKRKTCLSLTQDDESNKLPACFLGQCRPFPTAQGRGRRSRALALLADFGHPVSQPGGVGPSILPCILPLLLCCMVSCCFIFHRHLAKEKQPCTSQTF